MNLNEVKLILENMFFEVLERQIKCTVKLIFEEIVPSNSYHIGIFIRHKNNRQITCKQLKRNDDSQNMSNESG